MAAMQRAENDQRARLKAEKRVNWLSDVIEARPLVTERDRLYVGEGVLSELLLDLIAESRLHRRRPSTRQLDWVARMRGLSGDDTRDLQQGMRQWRR